MAVPTRTKGDDLLRRFTPDLIKILDASPAFGSVTFTITFHNDEPTRLNYGFEVSKLARPDYGKIGQR